MHKMLMVTKRRSKKTLYWNFHSVRGVGEAGEKKGGHLLGRGRLIGHLRYIVFSVVRQEIAPRSRQECGLPVSESQMTIAPVDQLSECDEGCPITVIHTGLSSAVSVMKRRKSSQPELMDVTKEWPELVRISMAFFKFSRKPSNVSAAKKKQIYFLLLLSEPKYLNLNTFTS